MSKKVQIVLDADVIIHFSEGGYLHLLPNILPECAFVVLSVVRGESACMAYARYNSHVVGNSNLRDIKAYCSEHGIAYLTTLDFLYYAYRDGLMTKQEIEGFVSAVRGAGSILPDIDIDTYTCSVF